MSEEPRAPAHWDVTHRAFLQTFLARQVLTFVEAQPILATILTAKNPERPTRSGDIGRDDFLGYVELINAEISPFDFEIRSTKHQKSQDEIWALVNTTSDPITQMSTIHTADEIAFVRRVLNAMFDTYNTQEHEVMAITMLQAMKLHKSPQEDARRDGGGGGGSGGAVETSTVAAITQAQAEAMMENMVQQRWFEKSRRGYYSLSPRALMELKDWLVDAFNEPEDETQDEEVQIKIKACAACKDIVTVGQRCSRIECLGRLHTHCVGKMFRAQGGQEVCPKCRSPWSHPLPVGEQAANTRDRQSNSTHRRSTNRNLDDANDDESD